jgi:two-component system, LytTR family, sensor kinase
MDAPAGNELNANGKQSVSGKLYWRCELGGWLAFGLLQAFPALLYNTPRQRLWPVLSPVILKVALGLAGTHLLHLSIRRRRWLQMSGGKLVLRLMGAGMALAAILAGVEYLVGRFLPTDMWSRAMDSRRIILNLVSWIVVLGLWITLYVMIHEFRGRRAREMRALRLEMMVQEAQLRGLRAQLNPHFLFNCLNGLREVIAENQERAQLMVTQLSALLRYSLQSNQSERVSLTDEIKAVKDYLSLEQIRFEERLRVVWFVDPDAAELAVPPMLLQTLVENALKHGIARRPQGGEVAIHIRLAGAELELEVLNSGRIDGEPAANAVGMKNAHELIKLLYGERGSLVLEDTADGHVRALVKLPIRAAEVTA